MSTTTHKPEAPAPATPEEPAKTGMAHIVEALGKGGKDEDLEGLLTQQMRWDAEDVILLFQALRGKKPAPPAHPNAKHEGGKAA